MRSLKLWIQALEFDPRLAEAACGRARVLQRQGHWDDADKAARDALAIDPECVEAARLIHALKQQKATDRPSGTSKR